MSAARAVLWTPGCGMLRQLCFVALTGVGLAVKVTPELAAARRAVMSEGVGDVPELLSWEDYKTTFVKLYSDAAEEAVAKAAFDENVAEIVRLNAAADNGEHDFRVGVNDFTDMPHQLWRSTYLGSADQMREAQREWKTLPQHEVEVGAEDPAPVDWRTKGAVGPVKNQGSCGGCWSFSTTGALEGAYQIATGSLRSLSEQQLIDCSVSFGNMGCKGGSMRMAFDYILANKGIDSEADYPYSASGPNACWKQAANRTVATLTKFTAVPTASETALVAATVLGPVSVAIEADHPVFQHYKSGVVNNASACGTKLDHGVLVVGFTATSYIVKNRY